MSDQTVYDGICGDIGTDIAALLAHPDPGMKALGKSLHANVTKLNAGWQGMFAGQVQATTQVEKDEQKAQWAKWDVMKQLEQKGITIQRLKVRKVDVNRVEEGVKMIFNTAVDTEEAGQVLDLHYYSLKDRSVRDLNANLHMVGRKLSKHVVNVNAAKEEVPGLTLKKYAIEQLLKAREKSDAAKEVAEKKKLKLKRKQAKLAEQMKKIDLEAKLKALQVGPSSAMLGFDGGAYIDVSFAFLFLL